MNLASENITVDSVEKFQIYEDFRQRFPCSHRCKIKLIDGRKWKQSITGDDIYILIQSIAKEKISFIREDICVLVHGKEENSFRSEKDLSFELQDITHFDTYAECPYEMFTPDAIKAPTADELLTSIFEKHAEYYSQFPEKKEREVLIDKWALSHTYEEVIAAAEEQFKENPYKKSILNNIHYYLDGYRVSGEFSDLDGRNVVRAPRKFFEVKFATDSFFKRKEIFEGVSLEYIQ